MEEYTNEKVWNIEFLNKKFYNLETRVFKALFTLEKYLNNKDCLLQLQFFEYNDNKTINELVSLIEDPTVEIKLNSFHEDKQIKSLMIN